MPDDLQTFESYRPLLFSIAYRMLGSAMEAEDMVQEAYLRYEAARPDIQSPKAYLTTIVTRLCLDQLKSARSQREEYVGTWLPEPILTGESPSVILGQQETISMAFMLLLEHLSPLERAIFLLREVFDYSYAEIAPIVDKTEANCRQVHRRARQYLAERRPRFEPSSEDQHRLIRGFIAAISSGDIEGLTLMLAQDAAVYADGGGKAPAARHPVFGQAAVARLMLGGARLVTPDMTFRMAEVNGAPALITYKNGVPFAAMIFTVEGGLVKTIHNVFNPDKLKALAALS